MASEGQWQRNEEKELGWHQKNLVAFGDGAQAGGTVFPNSSFVLHDFGQVPSPL